jgi:AraC family transcriptional regulator
VKPAGTPHEDIWGRSGTLIFSLKILPEAPGFALPRYDPHWAELGGVSGVQRLIASCFAVDRPHLRREAVGDLLALVGEREADHLFTAPPWLERARCQIHDAPDFLGIEEVAREAGVDRAHLSRMFRRCYGAPPSVYRQQVLAARAVAAIAHSTTDLSETALNAGYGDQAHMTRGVKAHTGITPGRLRRLLKS